MDKHNIIELNVISYNREISDDDDNNDSLSPLSPITTTKPPPSPRIYNINSYINNCINIVSNKIWVNKLWNNEKKII